jgi:uncharacterized protein with HEPN domain
MTPRDREILRRIIDCIDAVDGYTVRVGASWADDDMAVDAIAKRVEEIGEVAKRLTPDALELMPGVDWRGVKGIRDVMAHDYLDIEVDVIADVVADYLPGLRAAVGKALSET